MAAFVIVGIRRSGIHAIQSYIEEQLEDVLILNDVYPELNYWYHKPDVPKHKHTIAIFEDCELPNVMEARIFEWFKYDHMILILRDALNMMASRYKQLVSMEEKSRKRQYRLKKMFRLRTATYLYGRYAQEFIGDTNILGENTTRVSYNKFVTSTMYRRQIGIQLGLPDPEHFPQTVQDIANGSSFDQLELSGGRTNEMRVLDRWRYFQNDPIYWKYFRPNMLRYTRQIFGIGPEQKPDLEAG